MRLVIARCSVDYDGRLTAHLPSALRLLIVKADGSVLVHSDGGSYKPLNWMSPPCRLTEHPASADQLAKWTVINKAGEKISPINHVDKIKCPMLVIHGANDPRVPVEEAEQIVAALKKRMIPVEYLRYEDEGHGLASVEALMREEAQQEAEQLLQRLAPTLARNGGGAVVNVASALSWMTMPGAYAPSKTAFWGLTNALRLELADQKTQVVGAHLGYTDTPFTAHLDVPKSDPAVIVARILDSLEADEDEAIADDTSAQVKSILSGITTGILPG